MASKSSFCGLQVSTLSKYKLLFLFITLQWNENNLCSPTDTPGLATTHYGNMAGMRNIYVGDKTSCVTVARCSTLKIYRITNKIRFTTATWVKTLKGCITFKGTVSQLRLERTPRSLYSCQKWKWFVASLLQPCHKIYQNSKSASKLLSVTQGKITDSHFWIFLGI